MDLDVSGPFCVRMITALHPSVLMCRKFESTSPQAVSLLQTPKPAIPISKPPKRRKLRKTSIINQKYPEVSIRAREAKA